MRRVLTFSMLVLATTFSFHSSALGAVQPGKVCTRLNQSISEYGFKFKCVKVGKKNVWSKGEAISWKPMASSTKNPTSTPSPSASALDARSIAIANKTFYTDNQYCHSRGINAELQFLDAGNWKVAKSAMGWDDAYNCDSAHPVQPWVIAEFPKGTSLRWRFWLSGVFDLTGKPFTN